MCVAIESVSILASADLGLVGCIVLVVVIGIAVEGVWWVSFEIGGVAWCLGVFLGVSSPERVVLDVYHFRIP